MNCSESRDQLVESVEAGLPAGLQQELTAHLDGCRGCAEEAQRLASLRARLAADARAVQVDVTARVMTELARARTSAGRATPWWRRRLVLATLAAGLLALLLSQLLLTASAHAATILTDGVKAFAHVKTVHIQARMRTPPRDNFDSIGLDLELVPVELWKRFEEPFQYRIEKPGRVIAMDGKEQVLWIKPDVASRHRPGPGMAEFLTPLLDVDRVLQRELSLARADGSTLSTSREVGADGRAHLVVSVEAKARGDLRNDWVRNKFLSASDNRRVYRFNAENHRLEALEVFVHAAGGDVLVFAIDRIEYDPPLEDSLWTPALPPEVTWLQAEVKVLADNERYAAMTPEVAARSFFEACARQDWVEAGRFWQLVEREDVRERFGELTVVSIGRAFQSGDYPGFFVPFELRFRDGSTRKWNLALRNDNEARRWVVDGGL